MLINYPQMPMKDLLPKESDSLIISPHMGKTLTDRLGPYHNSSSEFLFWCAKLDGIPVMFCRLILNSSDYGIYFPLGKRDQVARALVIEHHRKVDSQPSLIERDS